LVSKKIMCLNNTIINILRFLDKKLKIKLKVKTKSKYLKTKN